MTNPAKIHTVDELREIVRKMQETLAAALEISTRPDWQNSCGLEFDRLVSKYFEMNAMAHKHPAMKQVREILRREREQQERS
jgi:NifB/MoaA-like Fe-S oxidoreductase